MSGLTESEEAAIAFGLPPIVVPRVLSVCENILSARLAEAWDEGYDEGADDTFGRKDANPYRATDEDDQP